MNSFLNSNKKIKFDGGISKGEEQCKQTSGYTSDVVKDCSALTRPVGGAFTSTESAQLPPKPPAVNTGSAAGSV